MPPAPLLEVRDLALRFGGITALAGVGLEVAEGETLAVIGPNGSGKTSLFNCITGLYRPTAGAIALRGESLLGLSPDRVTARVEFYARIRGKWTDESAWVELNSRAGGAPMQYASSAMRTCSAVRSAVEKTATVRMSRSQQARMTRTAISPLLAMRIFLNIRRPRVSPG